MKRVFCISIDNLSECIEVREVEAPVAGPGEVVIAMAAAPINPADLLLLTGRHVFRPSLPAPIGIEGAGRVASVGEGVTALVPGDRVALPFGNTWAEQVVMKAADVVKLPPDVDMVQAAMLSVNPVTAAGLLHGLQAGDWLIQNAANSAVGTQVIRLARRRGIRTVNIVRRESLVPELLRRGADVVLVGEHDLSRRLAEGVGQPIRRALDAIAGESAGRLHACVSEGGELICYGLLNSDSLSFPATQVVFRDVGIRGYSRLRWLKSINLEQRNALYAELCELLAAGVLNTEVEALYPLERAAEAVLHASREGRSGKIVLTCQA